MVTEVKEVQRDPIIKEKWQHYCAIFGDHVRDPSKHQDAFLAGFLQGLRTSVGPETQIFVGGLPPDTTEAMMREYFSQWGEITNVKLKENKGFGFVTFQNAETVNEIMANHEAHQIGGKSVDCKRKDPSAVPTNNVLRPNFGLNTRLPGRTMVQRPQNVPSPYGPMHDLNANRSDLRNKQMGVNAPRGQGPVAGVIEAREIFVGGLPTDIQEQQIFSYFVRWGTVARVELKHGKGFAFVAFESPDSVEQIVRNNTQHAINGKHIDCKKRVLDARQQAKQQGGVIPQAQNPNRPFRRPYQLPNNRPQINIQKLPNPEPGQIITDKVFVGGLPKECREENLVETFSQFGNITKIDIKNDKGFAFIHFGNHQAVDSILSQKDSIEVSGQWVDCKAADNRPSKFLTYVR